MDVDNSRESYACTLRTFKLNTYMYIYMCVCMHTSMLYVYTYIRISMCVRVCVYKSTLTHANICNFI